MRVSSPLVSHSPVIQTPKAPVAFGSGKPDRRSTESPVAKAWGRGAKLLYRLAIGARNAIKGAPPAEKREKIITDTADPGQQATLRELNTLLGTIFTHDLKDQEKTLYPAIMKWVVKSRENPRMQKQNEALYESWMNEASAKDPTRIDTIQNTILAFSQISSSALTHRLEAVA